jgi:hypothetical protein
LVDDEFNDGGRAICAWPNPIRRRRSLCKRAKGTVQRVGVIRQPHSLFPATDGGCGVAHPHGECTDVYIIVGGQIQQLFLAAPLFAWPAVRSHAKAPRHKGDAGQLYAACCPIPTRLVAEEEWPLDSTRVLKHSSCKPSPASPDFFAFLWRLNCGFFAVGALQYATSCTRSSPPTLIQTVSSADG